MHFSFFLQRSLEPFVISDSILVQKTQEKQKHCMGKITELFHSETFPVCYKDICWRVSKQLLSGKNKRLKNCDYKVVLELFTLPDVMDVKTDTRAGILVMLNWQAKTGAIPKQQNNSPCFLVCATWSDHLSSGWLTPSPSSALKHWSNKEKITVCPTLKHSLERATVMESKMIEIHSSAREFIPETHEVWAQTLPQHPESGTNVKPKPVLSVAQSFTHNLVTVLSHQLTLQFQQSIKITEGGLSTHWKSAKLSTKRNWLKK